MTDYNFQFRVLLPSTGIEQKLVANPSGVDPGGGAIAPLPNKKIPGRECLFAPLMFQYFCSNLHVIRHFCSEFWGLAPNFKFSGNPIRGAYSAPQTPSWWGGGSLRPAQDSHPRSQPFGPKLHPPPCEGKNFAPHNKFGSTPLLCRHAELEEGPQLFVNTVLVWWLLDSPKVW